MNENLSEISRYLQKVEKRRFLFSALCVLITTLVIGAGYMLPKQYTADGTVFIEENIIKDLVKGIAVTSEIDGEVKVLKEAILSRNIINSALKRMEPDLVNKGRPVTADYVADLQKRVNITVKGKELFTVSMTDENPRFAQRFLNQLISSYVEENVFSQREETYGANRFFDEQLKVFKAKLDEAESAIVDFRKNQRTYLSLNENTVLADLRKLTADIETLSMELENLEVKKTAIKGQLDSVKEIVEISSPESKNKERVVLLEDQMNKMLLTYTENYPEVIRLRAELSEARQRMSSAGGDAPSGERITTINPLFLDLKKNLLMTEAEVSSKRSMLERLRAIVAQKEQTLRDIPENQKQLNFLEQERDSAKKIYQELLGRTSQAEVSKQMEIGDKAINFKIIDPAILPQKPTGPNMILIICSGVLAGLGGAFLIVLMLSGLTPSISDISEILDLDLNILGVVPAIRDPAKEKRERRTTAALLVAMTAFYILVASALVREIILINA